MITELEAEEYLNPGGARRPAQARCSNRTCRRATRCARASSRTAIVARRARADARPHPRRAARRDAATPSVAIARAASAATCGSHAYPWATVSSTARRSASTPLAQPIELREGKHTVRFEHDWYEPVERTIEVAAGAADAARGCSRRLREGRGKPRAGKTVPAGGGDAVMRRRSSRSRCSSRSLRAHAQDATSDTIAYRVKQDDTLALIAAEFYGDRNKAIFIMVANKLTHPRPLKPGERLRIPVTREVIDRARRHVRVARARRTSATSGARPFLAEFNDMSPDDSLPAGTPLSIPFTVTHTAQATGDRSRASRRRTSATRSNAELLRALQLPREGRAREGRADHRPDLQRADAGVEACRRSMRESKARRERQQRVAGHARPRRSRRAKQAWRNGDFAEVKAALAELELDIDYLELAQAIEVGMLLGSPHVAFNDTKPALEAFKHVLERKPSTSSRRTSTRRRCSRCGRKPAGPRRSVIRSGACALLLAACGGGISAVRRARRSALP